MSDVRRRAGDPRVKAWLRSVEPDEVFLSVLVLGEIRRGVERIRVADPVQAGAIEGWLARLVASFGDRVLAVDGVVAEAWGRLGAIRPIPVEDGLMAATAMVHGSTFVTRNISDVTGFGVTLLNPWADRPAPES